MLRIWYLDNDIIMNENNKAGFNALVKDFMYKINENLNANRKSYNYEKRQRQYNRSFVNMKYHLDKLGWKKFMDGLTKYY